MTNHQSNDHDFEDDELFWSLDDEKPSQTADSKAEPDLNLAPQSKPLSVDVDAGANSAPTDGENLSFAQPSASHPLHETDIPEPKNPSVHSSKSSSSSNRPTPTDFPDLEDFVDDFPDLESIPPTLSTPVSTPSTEARIAASIAPPEQPANNVEPSPPPQMNPASADSPLAPPPSAPTSDTATHSTTPKEAPNNQAASLKGWNFSEKIALASFVAILVILVSLFINTFFKSTDITNQYAWVNTLPADGEIFQIKAVESYWQSATYDDVKLGVQFVPVLKLTLASQTSHGSIRIGFKNYDGKFVGDPKIEAITEGKFDNGSTEKLIHCTDGLLDEATLRGYLAQNEQRWSVQLTESNSSNSSLIKENTIGEVSISPYFIEN